MSNWEDFVDELVHKLNQQCKITYVFDTEAQKWIEPCGWEASDFSQDHDKLVVHNKYCCIKHNFSDSKKECLCSQCNRILNEYKELYLDISIHLKTYTTN